MGQGKLEPDTILSHFEIPLFRMRDFYPTKEILVLQSQLVLKQKTKKY